MSGVGKAFRAATIAIAAVLASFGIVYAMCRALDVNATPAILAATLAMSLSRRAEIPSLRKLAAEFALLPLVALTAGLVGAALRGMPPLGAALFVGGIVLSIWLRKHGETARTVSRVLAIPLICILAVPVHVEGISNRWLAVVLMIGAGLCAMLCSVAAAWIGTRIGWIDAEAEPRLGGERVSSVSSPPISTRMAQQMLAALALAFVVGMGVLHAHWSWVVLTAFIVCSGSVTRGDAVYKGLQRLGGAAGGAILATAMAHVAIHDPAWNAAIIFVVLFVGIWLRPLNYVWWAVCATLIFALLQGPQSESTLPLLGVRIAGIVAGALCGVAAMWFVYPIRTAQLARKRTADALRALRDWLDAGRPQDFAALDHHAAELERLAPPLRLHRKLIGSVGAKEHPAAWIDRMRALIAQARNDDFDRRQLGVDMRDLGAQLKARTQASAPTGKSERSSPGV